jgi:hypothetical protein
MMQQSANPMLGTLALLRKLSPPDAVVHIGAGGGIGALHQWREWSVPHALIVDADAEKLKWAELPLAENPNWQCKSSLLSDTEGDLTYYQATNPDEDGLIEPEGLRTLWPNLGTTTPTLRSATRLDRLIGAQTGIAQQPGNTTWGIVDCLPALPILRGAGGALNRWSVLCVRVLFEPCGEIHAGATLQAVEQFLKPMGFNLVHTESGNHPLVGHALFVKDWRTSLATENSKLTTARATETQAKQEALAQRDALSKEKAELATENSKLTTARAVETQAKEQALAQRDALSNEKAELAKQNAELAKDRTELVAARAAETQAKEQALAQRDEQTKLAAERQKALAVQKQEAANHQQRIQHLEAENQENSMRQQMLQEELLKAEAQIELIKDLLLREPGL